MRRFLLLIVFLMALAMVSDAQEATSEATDAAETCPQIVTSAVTLTKQQCPAGADTQNRVCYGYSLIESELAATSREIFEKPGDTVFVSEIQRILLSAMDFLTGEWGVAVFYVDVVEAGGVRTESAETTGPETIQIVLFGENEFSSSVVELTATEIIPVYALPDSGSQVLHQLQAGGETSANARLEDNSWLRVPVITDTNQSAVGWVEAASIATPAEIERLPSITLEQARSENNLTSRFGATQAYVFESGMNDAPCEEAPNSGMLIQTPEGVGQLTIVLNDIEITMQQESTAFLQSQANGEFQWNQVEGSAQVTSQDETRTVDTGQMVAVETGDDGYAVSSPDDPKPIDSENLQGLEQMSDVLARDVAIPDPLNLPPGVPIAGEWAFSFGINSATCPDGSVWPFTVADPIVSIEPGLGGLFYSGILYGQQATGVYVGSYTDSQGNINNDTLRVTGTDRIEGTKELDLGTTNCTLNVPFHLQLQRPSQS